VLGAAAVTGWPLTLDEAGRGFAAAAIEALGHFGPELTEEASVVGPHELPRRAVAVIEPEHVHEVRDNPCSVRLELPPHSLVGEKVRPGNSAGRRTSLPPACSALTPPTSYGRWPGHADCPTRCVRQAPWPA
jgi:hypothetical protein